MVYCWGEDNYDLMRKYSKNVHLVSGEKFDLVNSEMEHVLKLVASSLSSMLNKKCIELLQVFALLFQFVMDENHLHQL